ncbi:hypothetical protein OG357_24585 [Streptomyces sp. NBC_01255]|uniref:hypothetical protein n=1 Tax=Streptomyces sp. NBC_01255 TaxID=2903798 RepID=UPI002E366889|nr:hypothetical protein [Streptomyces sp. NBC_01255]
MHADIHLQLHRLQAAELHHEATASTRTHDAPRTPTPTLRVQLGWTLVEFGLRLVTPADRRPAPLAA